MDLSFAIVVMVSVTMVTMSGSLPTGAPTAACIPMRPHHPPTTTFGVAPFVLDVSHLYYVPGSVITGVLQSTNGSLFRGYLIEGRLADNSSTDPVGTFIDVGPNSHTICGQNNAQALTHSENSDKTHINFTWQAPDSSSGDVHFKVTIVQRYDMSNNVSRYWLDVYSATLLDCSIHPTEGECSTFTEEPYTGSTQSTQSTIPTTTEPSGLIPFDPDCGYTKGCFPACKNGCDYLATWHAHDGNVDFELQMKLDKTDSTWVAIGISPGGQMDGTSVISCLAQSGKMAVEASYNKGHVNALFSNKTLGIVTFTGGVSDGIIKCSWTRKMKMDGADTNLDLHNEYYILIGTGSVSPNGIKLPHTHNPYASSSKVDFLKNDIVGQTTSARLLVKVHGSLMLIAWVFLSSVGVVAARHCKHMLESKLFFKVKLWFQFHRPVMILAVLCVIAAFIAIFVEIKGFSQITPGEGKGYTKAHPYMGIVVTALALLNPIMAVFRPSPDHKNRPIFNWAHFLVGSTCHISAVITIFMGLDLDRAKVDGSARYIMAAYSAVFVCVQFMFETYRKCKYRKESNKVKQYYNPIDEKHLSNERTTKIQTHYNESVDVHPPIAPPEKNKQDDDHVLLYMLLGHMILMAVFAGFLIGAICAPSTYHSWFS